MKHAVIFLLAIVMLWTIIGCNQAQPVQNTPKKVLFVIAPEKFYDDELFQPVEEMKKANIAYTIASTEKKEITGVKNGKATATEIISQVKVDEYNAISVIGGEGTIAHLWENKDLAKLLNDAYAKGKLVTGICAGSVVLAKAGLLKGVDATTYPADPLINALKAGGANYIAAPVVVTDKRIITANGPEGATAFGVKIAEALAK